MRIGFISHWYDPEGGSAAVPGTIARALSERGHEVQVVTGFPIYPTGRVFEGYNVRPYQREALAGVTVHRSPIYPSHDTRASRRMLNYLSFAASGSVTAMSRLRSCDVIYVYSSPATAAIPGLIMHAIGKPYVMHVHDLWPDTVSHSEFIDGHTAASINRTLHHFCNLTYRKATTIAVTAPGMADILTSRSVPKDKICYVPNWADERSFIPNEPDGNLKRSLGLSRPFVAMYAGNLGEMQGLDVVVAAANRLRSRRDIEFAFVGAGVAEPHLRQHVARLGLDNVQFIPPQPFSRMAQTLAIGDVQLISLKDVPLFRATIPSKLQANLSAGRPIVAAVAGDAARIVNESGAGWSTRPGDSVALAARVAEMSSLPASARESMSHSARKYYQAEFSERVIGDRLSSILVEAARAKTACVG